MTHKDCIIRFRDRKPNRMRGNEPVWDAGNVYCDDDTLYSYGRHFPLARIIGKKNGKPLFIKNGDSVSRTTSRHQGDVQRYITGPTVSLSAIEAAGFRFHRLEPENIVDFVGDSYIPVIKDKDTGKMYRKLPSKEYEGTGTYEAIRHVNALGLRDNEDWSEVRHLTRDEREYRGMRIILEKLPSLQPFPKPEQGMLSGESPLHDPRYVEGYWHTLSGVLLRRPSSDGSRYFLCGLDESSYFVAALPGRPRNIADAYDSLKPPEVLQAEKEGKRVLRQGEWFFVDTDLTDEELCNTYKCSMSLFKRRQRLTSLPAREGQNNRHVTTCPFGMPSTGYATGYVYHRDSTYGSSTGEHRKLELGNTWWRFYRNNEIMSWSMGGTFD